MKHLKYAIAVTAISGLVGWSLRVAAGDPHPIMVGIATASIVGALCACILWMAEVDS